MIYDMLTARTARRLGFIALAGALARMTACASSQKEELPAVDEDGLQLVKSTKHSAVYRDPKADFSEFNRVTIADVEVAFKKNWLRDQNEDRVSLDRRITQEDADKIKASLAD